MAIKNTIADLDPETLPVAGTAELAVQSGILVKKIALEALPVSDLVQAEVDRIDDDVATLNSTKANQVDLAVLQDFREWDATRAYATNDPVFRHGIPYRLKAGGNPANDPATSPTDWEIVGGGVATIGNIATDPAGSKGSTDWTMTNATVTTETTTLTGFATELKILGTGAGTAIWTIPVPAQLRGQELELRYEGYLNVGTPSIAVLDASDNVLPFSGTIPSTVGKFESVGRFYTNASATVKIRITVANLDDLRMTNIYLGRRQVVYGAAIGPWTPYTPTFHGLGTPTNVDFRWRRVGENLEIDGTFNPGTATSAEARVSLPNGLSVASNVQNPLMVGVVGRKASSSSYFGTYALVTPNSAHINFSRQSSTATNMDIALGTDISTGTNQTMSMQVSIPIAQWQGSGTVQLAENQDTLYLSNTENVVNTNGVVGKSYYGIEGAPILALTSATHYDIALPRSLMPDENPVLEVRAIANGVWVPVSDAFILSLRATLQYNYGATGQDGQHGGVYIVNHAPGQIRVFFSYRLLAFNSLTTNIAATQINWSQVTAAADGYDRWRVRIEKAGARQETPTVHLECLGNSVASSGNVVKFTEIEDTHSAYDPVTGEWVCPVEGIYTISTTCSNDGTTRLGFEIQVNGVMLRRYLSPNSTGSTHVATVATSKRLSKGVVVRVVAQSFTVAATATQSGFTITRVGA